MTIELAAANQFGIDARKITAVRRAFRVASDQGTFALKESRQTEADILFIHAAKEYLYEQGMINLDRYVLTPQGSPYVDIRGRLFVMSPWVESREAHYESLVDGVPAALCLARLHQKAKGFAPPLVTERTFWGTWPSSWQERLVKLQQYKTMAEQQTPGNRFGHRFLRHVDTYLAQGREALALLDNTQYKTISADYEAKGSVCHHDYSERNVLFTRDGGIHLVDFDYCICDLPVHDLVNFLRRVAKFTNYSGEMLRRILAAYLEENPLPKEELQLFVPLWLWPQKFWEVVHQYYGEGRTRPRRKYSDRLQRRCRTKHKERSLLEQIAKDFGLS